MSASATLGGHKNHAQWRDRSEQRVLNVIEDVAVPLYPAINEPLDSLVIFLPPKICVA